jgi:lysine biosynthesis protein LysW
MAALCVECDAELDLGGRMRIGQRILCPNCGVELEVISTRPLEVDIAVDDGNDWDDFDGYSLDDEDDLDDFTRLEGGLEDDLDDELDDWEDDDLEDALEDGLDELDEMGRDIDALR